MHQQQLLMFESQPFKSLNYQQSCQILHGLTHTSNSILDEIFQKKLYQDNEYKYSTQIISQLREEVDFSVQNTTQSNTLLDIDTISVISQQSQEQQPQPQARAKSDDFKKIKQQQKNFLFMDSIIIPPKQRGKRSKQYRNDELAKKILRSLSTQYHKAFLSQLSRRDKRGGDFQQQRVRLNLFLQYAFYLQRFQIEEIFNDHDQIQILDATFLTVKAKKQSRAKKREDLFNGTKAKCRTLFRSLVGKIFFKQRFINSWNLYVEQRKMTKKCKQQYECYLSQIIEDS